MADKKNTYHLTQATSGMQPERDATSLSSASSWLRFYYSSQRFLAYSGNILNADTRTIVIVTKQRNTTLARPDPYVSSGTATKGMMLCAPGSTPAIVYQTDSLKVTNYASNTAVKEVATGSQFFDDQPHVLHVSYDASVTPKVSTLEAFTSTVTSAVSDPSQRLVKFMPPTLNLAMPPCDREVEVCNCGRDCKPAPEEELDPLEPLLEGMALRMQATLVGGMTDKGQASGGRVGEGLVGEGLVREGETTMGAPDHSNDEVGEVMMQCDPLRNILSLPCVVASDEASCDLVCSQVMGLACEALGGLSTGKRRQGNASGAGRVNTLQGRWWNRVPIPTGQGGRVRRNRLFVIKGTQYVVLSVFKKF
eukprot:jgi/Mesvir1/15712/Mv03293-RA.1